MTALAAFAAGLVILLVSGEALVRGAVGLSLRLGLSPLLIGMTVIALGTSAPELLVSVDAVLAHAPGIALGNVVGSNIANLLLVLGLTAVVAPIATCPPGTQRGYIAMLLATALFIAMTMLGPIGRPQGIVLLFFLTVFVIDGYRDARRHPAVAAELEAAGSTKPLHRALVALLIGLVGLPVGAKLVVGGAVVTARKFGISEEVIGLTLVAVGTSLPEIAASVMAAVRGQPGIAVGNVIGSNLFNILGITGVASTVGTLDVPDRILHVDNWVMLVATLVIAPSVLGRIGLSRLVATGFIVFYLGFIAQVAT